MDSFFIKDKEAGVPRITEEMLLASMVQKPTTIQDVLRAYIERNTGASPRFTQSQNTTGLLNNNDNTIPVLPTTGPSLDAVLKQFMEGGYRRASTNAIPSLSKFSVEKTGKGYTVNAKGRPRTNTNTQPQTKQPVTINANMSRDEALRRMVALEGGINARYHTDKGRHAARSAFSKELSQIKSLKPNEVGAWVSNGFGKGTLLTSPEDVYGDERISRAENLASKRGVADLVSSMTRGLLAKYPELKKKNINKLQGDLLQLLSVARPLVDFENVSSEVSDVTNATLNRR